MKTIVIGDIHGRYNHLCLESFSGDRVYTPEEIMQTPYPLVLDLSHIDPGRSYALIDHKADRIAVVHVSEVARHEKAGTTRPHMPIGKVCMNAFKMLKEKHWDGVLTLEYLPEFHSRMFEDRAWLEASWESL
jgi:sugar phosphate isomerase/epimerase